MLPAAVAWVGALIVDAVIAAIQAAPDAREAATRHALLLVAAEAGLVAALAGAQRGISLCQSLLRAQLGQRVNAMILEKALTLELAHFEDSEFYDKLTRARREASSRPLSLVMRTFGLAQNGVSLVSYGTLLAHFSPWAVAVLVLAGLPSFLAEARFSGTAFRLFLWRSPETRMQHYLETVLAREDHAKEVKLFGVGPLFLQRYRDIFRKLYREDRDLTIRRDSWGFALGLIGTATLYGAYAWVAVATIAARITLGQMTMYVMLFRQGQAAVSASLAAIGGMYEDNLYLATLYEYLETPVDSRARARRCAAPDPRTASASRTWASSIPAPTRRCSPASTCTSGRDRRSRWSARTAPARPRSSSCSPASTGPLPGASRSTASTSPTGRRKRCAGGSASSSRTSRATSSRVGDNIGTGDVRYLDDESRWREAAEKGMAAAIIEELPEKYHTPLGKWFNQGRDLSGGEWQKIALARAFMRTEADILVLDEPTAAMDAAAEATIFEHFRALTKGRIAILISHRFSTVRMADQIVVLQDGRIVERGSHAELVQANGHYARLFELQARGYQ